MKRTLVLVTALLLGAAGANAQMLKDNSKISYEARKKDANKYELIVHMKLEKGWHVYSIKPGGDGSLKPAIVSFRPDPKVKYVGGIKERGKLISEVMIEGDPKINMYADRVDYVQEVTVNGTTTVTGTYEYQICNDRTCLPATKKEFKIVVKG